MTRTTKTYQSCGVAYTTSEMLQRFLAPTNRRSGASVIPVVRCADGFIFSMQASEGHACQPRNDTGPWTAVEVYFSHRASPRPKRGWGRSPSGGVDGCVPLDMVAALVDAHGGLAYEMLS